MNIRMRICLITVILLHAGVAAFPQENSAATSRTVRLNVIVSAKSGTPVSGLGEQDFSLLDNKAPRSIQSFKVVSSSQEPVKVILLIDAVNTNFDRVAYVRNEVQKFLKANDGKLANPTTIAVLTDDGTQMQKGFTQDGNALNASLEHYTIGLRQLTRSTGIWGANDRVQISLTAVQQLAAYALTIPGRKIVLWVSPGWPLLSGNRFDLDSKQQRQIFANVVAFSKELQQANLTLYNINPLGPEESLFREDYYQDFLKGVSKAGQTDLADLSLQVLAVQSGGLSLNGQSDVAGNLEKCLSDTESWYEVTFATSVAEQRDEYHHIQITVDKPGLTARTRDGYYAQP
ncbi:VWFA-related protein [Silvibacterium bohemicum]|uniref:VWFA-related protein n=1 Tax=Silvibacterium bohemicum TaxID=1577686 RepID=A0A841JT02_9BACT|nr:VWA domain-containing protein [Silvibacterium bohemicum]MBB6144542.1 VWFA-related protein [Silvibacterium bohemicum]